MKYCVITHNNADELSQDVNKLLDENWELLGGVAVTRSESVRYDERHGDDYTVFTEVFAQALIHRDPDALIEKA